MSLPLPDPLVVDPSGGLDGWGVQRNFEALAGVFPLAPGDGNFAQVPQCRAYHSVDQSIATGTETTFALDSERWDLGAPSPQHDTATNNSRLTCVVPGLYFVSGHVTWASNATGYRYCYLRLNGSLQIAFQSSPANSGLVTIHSVSTNYRLAAGDYVEFRGTQNSGGALNALFEPARSVELSFHWVSP